MIDRKSGFFNRCQHTVQSLGRLKPVTPGAALGGGDGMGTGRGPSSRISCLIAHPIFFAEALANGLIEGEMATYPGDLDPLGEQGPEVGRGAAAPGCASRDQRHHCARTWSLRQGGSRHCTC